MLGGCSGDTRGMLGQGVPLQGDVPGPGGTSGGRTCAAAAGKLRALLGAVGISLSLGAPLRPSALLSRDFKGDKLAFVRRVVLYCFNLFPLK